MLIIAALTLTMLLLATGLYVVSLQKNKLVYNSTTDLDLPAYKQGLRNTMISALANITNDGPVNILAANLGEYNNFTTKYSYTALVNTQFTLLNTGSYQNGIWTSQNSSGRGIASACTTFKINASSTSGVYSAQFDLNVTSMIEVTGTYSRLDGSGKQVILTLKLFNDGHSALARNMVISYETDGELDEENWVIVDLTDLVDVGDGSYSITFNANTEQRGNSIVVFVSCIDPRGILVETLATPVLT